MKWLNGILIILFLLPASIIPDEKVSANSVNEITLPASTCDTYFGNAFNSQNFESPAMLESQISQADLPFSLFMPAITRNGVIGSTVSPSGRISHVLVEKTTVAPFDKFEVTFDVQSSAPKPYLPFDPSPPAGVNPALGVTVNAYFSPDNWQTVYRQPAFYFQPFTHTIRGSKDHYVPAGSPRWAVRMAPQMTGIWQYRICLEDSDGVEVYPALSESPLAFTVSGQSTNLYKRHGYIHPSQVDKRYFEFQDGTPFVGVGFNDRFDTLEEVTQKMQSYEQNRMNFFRVWLSGSGINGSQWTSWGSHHLPGDGYLPGVQYDIQNTYNGGDVALRLDDNNPCLFTDFWQGGIPVEPQVTYKLSARIKLQGVTGPASAGDYGFVIKQADWLGTNCDQPGNGVRLISPLAGNSGWQEVTGSITTRPGQYFLDYLYLARENATGGSVFVDEVRLWRADDPDEINLLREPYANSHLYIDPINASLWDSFIEQAEDHGVYLKIVVDEKNEWIRNHIDAQGVMTPNRSNDNFYAAPHTKVRWLQEAWWRYIIARWGYSTAIHSFEYINEGDPYNEAHYNAALDMAQLMHANDPAKHMATTSFWSSFPNYEFWSNPDYQEIDYADIHAYISTGWGIDASFVGPGRRVENPSEVYAGNAGVRFNGNDNFTHVFTPRGMVIQGLGEWIIRYWMKSNQLNTNCSYGSSGSMVRVRWYLDGGNYWDGREGIVPTNRQGQDYVCTSLSGTFDWTQFRSNLDRDGNELPVEQRLVLTDARPHSLALQLENQNGIGGTVWIDEVELVSPAGVVQRVIGQFDVTPMDDDTAWYNRAYAEVWGADGIVGVQKPLVRGETGVDFPDKQDWNRDLMLDTQGIWLHNNIWGQVNSGAMADLFWWAEETIPASIYTNFFTFRNFIEGIPLNNGYYRDASASASHPDLRVWGQRDDYHGKIHLWIQNRQHTWKRVVYGPAPDPVSGTIRIPDVLAGTYQLTWWDTYAVNNPIIKTEKMTSDGELVFSLPFPLTSDLAVKIERLP